MSKRYKFKNQNYPKSYNKFDQDWKVDNNYFPKNSNYYNKQKYNNNNYNFNNYENNSHNNYQNNSYNNYQNNDYYNYQNSGYNNYRNNGYYYHQNNAYGNYYNNKFKRGRYPYFSNRKYYKEVELDAQKEIDEKFVEELKKIGFYIKEVKGDGNCLFRSVSEQLEGNENNYEIYRQKCVEYMKDNKDAFIPFLEEEEPIDNYIEKISKDGEWGGNLEIYALSMALKVNFYIYMHEQPIYIVKTADEPTKNIMMTYHNGKHYNSLRKLEEKNEEDKKEDNDGNKLENKKEEKKEENGEENKDLENKEKEKKIDDAHDLISKVSHLNI